MAIKLEKRTSPAIMKRAMIYLTTGMSMFCLEVGEIGDEEDKEFCEKLMVVIDEAAKIWEKLCPFSEEEGGGKWR